MKRFADLYDALDQTTSTLAKVAAMRAYFGATPPEDAAWALYFLMGRRPKRLLSARLLAQWTVEQTGLPEWMLGECYGAVGDAAEMLALLLESQATGGLDLPLHVWMEERILPLKGQPAELQRDRVRSWWPSLPRRELFLLNKLLTGELRVGVSATLVVRALAEHLQVPPETLTHRVMGPWEPTGELMRTLAAMHAAEATPSQPYPFFLASPLDEPVEGLGPREAWLAEWKWDGIRGQLLRRKGEVFLWSRGEELITARFPEIVEAARRLPDGVVLDGEVLAFAQGAPLPFSKLQQRIGRQKLTAKVLADAPAAFMAYDLLEENSVDLRALPLEERRQRLNALVERTGHPSLLISPVLNEVTWEALADLRRQSRPRRVEGLMLKRRDSPYRTGRRRGEWWKWKIDPYRIDAVLLYSQPGSGRRATLLTDHTFGIWEAGNLVPVAKAYSGLTDLEITELDRWIRTHTVERYGPVRHVEPTQVFELHFENIAPSPRHKAGVAVRFPRIARWRKDKPAKEADTLESLWAILNTPPEQM
nr:DNA ligase [uncultured bacterium]